MSVKVKIAHLCVSGMLWMLESNLKKDSRQAQSDSPPAKGEYPKGEGVFPLCARGLRRAWVEPFLGRQLLELTRHAVEEFAELDAHNFF